MNVRNSWIVLLLLCSTQFDSSASAADEPVDLDKRISIELAGAGAVEVFQSFAALVSAEPDLDPDLDGEVTIQLAEVSTRTTLNAVCEMLSCKWWITEGPPRRLSVKVLIPEDAASAKPPGTLETAVSLSLEDAPVEEVLRSFAKIGRWELIIDKPTVSVELEETPIHQALDEVCGQVDCIWTLDESGDGGILRIKWID